MTGRAIPGCSGWTARILQTVAATEAVAMDTGSYAEMAEVTLKDGQVPDGNYAVRALSIDWHGKSR